MPVNVGNQFTGGLIDNLQAGPQFFQFLALAPAGDIAKAVLAGLNTIILADRIGNALGLHFLRVPVLGRLNLGGVIFLHLQPPLELILVHIAPVCIGGELFRLRFGGKALGVVLPGPAIADHDHLPGGIGFRPLRIMELAVGDLMDSRRDRLNFTHARAKRNPLPVGGKVAVHIGRHRLKLNGNRGGSAQRLQENLIVLDITGQAGRKFRQGLSIRLAHIEHLHRAEQGNLNFLFLHDDLAILIQHRCFGIRVQLLFLDFLFIWCRGNNGNTMLTPFHMALKLIFPLVVSGHQRGVRALHIDEHGVVDGVAVEPGHHGEVAHILFTLEQFLDALLNALGNFPQSLPVGGFLSHDFHSPFYGRNLCGVFRKPLVLFLGAAVNQKVQEVARIVLFLDGLHKTGMRVLVRRFGGIIGFPFTEQMVVVGQNTPAMFSLFL